MKLIVACALFFTASAWASDSDDLQACIHHWTESPFDKDASHFRVISTSVRVMGIGTEIEDSGVSPKPELILIKPNVSVLSKTTMNLRNSNGWYCLKGKVDVLGKSEINLDCKAHLASTDSGVTVAGKNSSDKGVTVLGKVTINKINCQ